MDNYIPWVYERRNPVFENVEPHEYDYSAGDKLFERNIARMKMGVMKVPKLSYEERKLLEFCHGRDMKQFLKEEFEKHPIILNEDGELISPNPFTHEDF